MGSFFSKDLWQGTLVLLIGSVMATSFSRTAVQTYGNGKFWRSLALFLFVIFLVMFVAGILASLWSQWSQCSSKGGIRFASLLSVVFGQIVTSMLAIGAITFPLAWYVEDIGDIIKIVQYVAPLVVFVFGGNAMLANIGCNK